MTSIYENKNSFWPEYKNLEQQVIDLTNHVCFCDDQVNVFSRANSNLILQIASEVESISKELYRRHVEERKPDDKQVINHSEQEQSDNGDGENNLDEIIKRPFDYYYLKKLDRKWHLTSKEISVTGVNFYFQDNFQSFTPLDKVYSKSEVCKCPWKEAYKDLKHDNRVFIKNATIGNLISALGALFILNLYYRDLNSSDYKFYLNGELFDSRVGSDIFTVKCYEVLDIARSINFSDESIMELSLKELEKSIYIKRFDNETLKFYHCMSCLDYEQTKHNFETSNELKPYFDNQDSSEFKDLSMQQICLKIGGRDLFQKICVYDNVMRTFGKNGLKGRREIVLNKHSKIYDTLTYEDYKQNYGEINASYMRFLDQ